MTDQIELNLEELEPVVAPGVIWGTWVNGGSGGSARRLVHWPSLPPAPWASRT